MGTFYVVATPIGNLKDINLRALEVLTKADIILAEDTRVTRKLLSHYSIKTPLIRYNEHRPQRCLEEVVERLRKGQKVALVSDAGTPGVSDPGSKLVNFIRKRAPNIFIEAVPGPSAAVAALSVSGIPANSFTFLGYPPAKKKRNKFFANLKDIRIKPIVIYESTHRLIKTLDNLVEFFGENKELFIAKELTKIHETHFLGTIKEAKNYFTNEKKKGEFVIIIP